MSDLDCNEFVELVTTFLDGALDDETERRFLDHLSACDGCDTYLDQMRQTTQTLGTLPPDSLADDAGDKLLDAFRDWNR